MAKTFVVLFDAHCGKHRARRKGRLVWENSYDLPTIRAAVEFVRDIQPDIVVLGGDQIDAGSVSHWNSAKPLLVEGLRLDHELDTLDQVLLSPIEDAAPRATKLWLQGNHERFVDDFVESHPALAGVVNIGNYLELEDRGWKFYDHGEIAKLGKLNIVHGDKIGGGVHHAKRALDMYGRNIRYGHHHTYQAHTNVSAVDVVDRHTAVAVPCLANKNPGYSANRPNAWVNGWLYGGIDERGNFWDQVAICTNGTYRTVDNVYGRR